LPVWFSSTALGLILGIAAAIVANALRPRFNGAEEIEDRLGLRVLGEIPALGRPMPKPLELFNGSRNWRMAKAYQRLGVNLEIARPSKDASAVAVTSFGRGEGKTTVTANLAWAVALLRQTVVGIDGDLHEPALHEYFDLLLTNGAGYPPEPAATGNPWLTIVPASRSDHDATAVLTSELPRVLGAFRDRLVFVDSPAISDRADATLIASMAQAALLVVDIRSRQPAEVERAIHDLRRVGVEVLGIVVNRSRAPFPR
jgi:Mrp family chromosome partitioning ATPase